MRKNPDLRLLATLGVFAALVLLLVRAGQSPRIDTCVAGDVESRNLAVIPPPLAHAYLDASQIQFGLGTAAIGDWRSLGDGLVTGGQAWLRTTHHASPRYYSLVANRYFQTNFLVYVPPGIPPMGTLQVAPGTSADQLRTILADRYPDGVMLEGYALMRQLHTIAIAQPAIDGKVIRNNTPYYYTEPMESLRYTWVYAVGYTRGAAGQPGRQTATPGARWLYSGPRSPANGLTHVLVLNRSPREHALAPARDSVVGIGQLIGDSVFIEGEFRLYPIRKVAVCEEALVRN